jgi:endogenous inhibitor of DNA gyrase (YacG/DUF329 family)
MNKKCPKCGKIFIAGRTGMLSPFGCDVCLGVERIADLGSRYSAWLPGETYHYYVDSRDTAVMVTREAARASKNELNIKGK